MKLYMVVTVDEYETPIFFSDKVQNLAEYLGVSKSTVFSYIKKGFIPNKNMKIIIVEDDD
jgi:hypothetical protein